MGAAKYSRRPSDDELRQLYVDDGLRCPAIARLIDSDASTVRDWLVAAGIPTIPRGQNPAVHFKKGHKLSVGRRHSPETIAIIRQQTIGRGILPYLKNGVHWLKNLPPSANPNYKGGCTPERQTFYRSAEWKAACVAVWHRADAKCERCRIDHRKIDRRKNKFHVHHIVSFQVKALRAEPTNLALLCQPCHMFVHSARNAGLELLACPTDIRESLLVAPTLTLEREDDPA